MEIIINGEKVKGDIREIMMTNASGDVTIIKSLGDNQCLRKEKGEFFYFIDHIEHIIELREGKDFICDEFIFMEKHVDEVRALVKEYKEDILEMVR